MVTRVLELIARPGASAALCGAIDDDVRVLLSDADGFLELVTLISEGEARLVVVLTVWRGRTAAAEYEKDVYPIIVELLHLSSNPLPWNAPSNLPPPDGRCRTRSSRMETTHRRDAPRRDRSGCLIIERFRSHPDAASGVAVCGRSVVDACRLTLRGSLTDVHGIDCCSGRARPQSKEH
jgi:hypothetical protein